MAATRVMATATKVASNEEVDGKGGKGDGKENKEGNGNEDNMGDGAGDEVGGQ